MERQEGYYWVKRAGEFEIAEWTFLGWYLVGLNYLFNDSEFEFINENRIKAPGELPD